MNVHLTYYDTPYGDFSRVKEKLIESGIRNVREGWQSGNADLHIRLTSLGCAGIGMNLIMGTPDGADTHLSSAKAAPYVSSLAQAQIPGLVSLEGPNEYDAARDDADWARTLRRYQADLYREAKRYASTGSLVVIAPSLTKASGRASLGLVMADLGNLHSYTGGQQPSEVHLRSELTLARRVTGERPVVATETGFNTAVDNTDGQPGVSANAASTYIIRQYLENFRSGVLRTFTYELINEGSNRHASESNYGLLNVDFSEKPSFTHLANLIALLRDKAVTGGAPLAVAYRSTGPADLRSLMLQKSDGSSFLALWRETPVWDKKARAPIAVPAEDVTVTVGERYRVTGVASPHRSRSVRTVSPSRHLSLSLSGEAVLVRINPM